MLKRLTHTLIAFIVALAAAVLPVSARAMPMSSDMSRMSIQQHCPSCPQPSRNGVSPDMMPACQILACGAAIATLPSSASLLDRVMPRATYLMAIPVRWTAAARAPDPFPPRPIALA